MAKNANKSLTHRIHSFIPEILLVFGIVLVATSITHNLLRLRSLRMDRHTVETYIAAQPVRQDKPIPSHIFIKWFVDVDIEPEVYQEREWTISENAASYLVDSAKPGELGNLILYGHNKRSILGNIRALKGGEIIELTLSDGSKKMYKVESLHEVNPRDTKLLSSIDSEVLTIYTCSGLLDSLRFVVRATPL